jgi:hypothetical protein
MTQQCEFFCDFCARNLWNNIQLVYKAHVSQIECPMFYATFWCRKNEQILYVTDPSQDQAKDFEYIMVY